MTSKPTPADPRFVQIDGQVWASPEWFVEDSQCTAQTTAKRRCKRPLDYGQICGWSPLHVPGGTVDGYYLDDPDGRVTREGRRYLAQRCELHFDTDALPAAEPDWVLYDLTLLEHCASRNRTADDVWMDLSPEQRITVRVAAPELAELLESRTASQECR